MRPDDKRVIVQRSLTEMGIIETKCDMCDGKFVFQRVINVADTPYSIIVCDKCGYEVYSLATERENQLIEYANMIKSEAQG